MKHLFQNTDSDRNLKVRNNPDGMCFSSAGGFKITVSFDQPLFFQQIQILADS